VPWRRRVGGVSLPRRQAATSACAQQVGRDLAGLIRPGAGCALGDSQATRDFALEALQAFRKFGFQLLIVATVQNATTIQPYIDSVVMVSRTEPTGRNARPVASVATRTISEFTTLRHEMRKTSARVPAGV
jgi:hypothetical protein